MRRPLSRFALAAAALALFASPALACGGFFCGNVPINQAGERVIFGVDGDQVTAIIQIQYQGDAKNFAWVVPVPVQPTLGVSSDEIFNRLGQATRPTFRLNYHTDSCAFEPMPALAEAGAAAPNGVSGAAGGVTVVATDSVGPYDTAILKADDATALTNWLTSNNYNIPPAAQAIIPEYVAKGSYFVGLKLQQDKGSGDLEPIVLKMTESEPCVPIRLTSIAATPNMPLILWVFGQSRAIPLNYRSVKLNEALIDWVGASPRFFGGPAFAPGFGFNSNAFGDPAPNYRQVVSESMKEAGGNGWVTEFASSSATVQGALQNPYDTSALASLTDPLAFMREVQRQGFPNTGPILGLLRTYLPLPADLAAQGWTEQGYWNYLTTGFPPPISTPSTNGGATFVTIPSPPVLTASDTASFSAPLFAADLDTDYEQPMKDAQSLITDHPYMTRFYTTMSPDQMTKDPTFSFNSSLPDVSNVHVADGTYLCSPGKTAGQSPLKITLADGTSFVLQSNLAPLPLTAMPAAQEVDQLTESGPPEVVTDNAKAILAALGELASAVNTAIQSGNGSVGPGCACARLPGVGAGKLADTSGADHEAAFWGLTLASVVFWRRKKLF